ncbi:MAG: MarR family transcriptional regulator [Gemmatimonadaceae bacterium]
MAADRTHPFDVVVALRLLTPSTTLAATAAELAVAPSQVHASLTRLEAAGLLKPGTRSTNPRALGEFILFGVRYAFPAVRGRLAEGVPTAHSAPALAAEIDAVDVLIWPAPLAPEAVRGFSIKPLYGKAHRLVSSSPETYRLLTLVDAIRLRDPRSRSAARTLIEQALGWRDAV